VSGQLHAPAALTPKERAPGTPWIRGWVGPRAVLDAVLLIKLILKKEVLRMCSSTGTGQGIVASFSKDNNQF